MLLMGAWLHEFYLWRNLKSNTSPTTRQPFHLPAASSDLAMSIELNNENTGQKISGIFEVSETI
jgi:hypothetical protein